MYRTGSCPEYSAFLELNKFLDNIAPSNSYFTEKSRRAPVTVACEEAHCEKSSARGTQWRYASEEQPALLSDSRTRNGVELARRLNIQVRILLDVETVHMHHLLTTGKI